MRRPSALAAAALVGSAVSAHAGALTLDLPGAAEADRTQVTYACTGDRQATAEYVNLGGNSLVVLTVDGRTLLMVGVMSGSGARYAGQHYIWWTKGNSADFYDLARGEDAPPDFSCTAG